MFSPKQKSQKPAERPTAEIAGRSARPAFPPAWIWLVDEAIPSWVKKNYSPRESWKDKPFSKEDARFFFKGIEELSELFTEERSATRRIPNYFSHPKYRSAYLLYFLPLQAAKFITLFNLHPKAIEAALEHGQRTGTLKIADLGSGPGTASLALLLWLMAVPGELPAKIELCWVDSNKEVMEDGKKLIELLSGSFPKLRGKVTVQTHAGNWWHAPEIYFDETSLLLLGHVLNEASPRSRESDAEEGHKTLDAIWPRLLSKMRGGGALIVEPAARRSAQLLSRLRDAAFEENLLEAAPTSLWGPCLHAGACPLAEGRDWCHFSVPVHIPGEWFKDFSQALSSERQWAKFSYLWFSAPGFPAPKPDSSTRRVVSDILSAVKSPSKGASGTDTVLLCEPGEPRRFETRKGSAPYRGDLIRVPRS